MQAYGKSLLSQTDQNVFQRSVHRVLMHVLVIQVRCWEMLRTEGRSCCSLVFYSHNCSHGLIDSFGLCNPCCQEVDCPLKGWSPGEGINQALQNGYVFVKTYSDNRRQHFGKFQAAINSEISVELATLLSSNLQNMRNVTESVVMACDVTCDHSVRDSTSITAVSYRLSTEWDLPYILICSVLFSYFLLQWI